MSAFRRIDLTNRILSEYTTPEQVRGFVANWFIHTKSGLRLNACDFDHVGEDNFREWCVLSFSSKLTD